MSLVFVQDHKLGFPQAPADWGPSCITWSVDWRGHNTRVDGVEKLLETVIVDKQLCITIPDNRVLVFLEVDCQVTVDTARRLVSCLAHV